MATDAREIIADALWRLDGIHVTPDGPDEYHRANADALIERLRSAGLLIEPGGETRTEESWSHLEGTEEYRLPGRLITRTVTKWPDGTELITPWCAADVSVEQP